MRSLSVVFLLLMGALSWAQNSFDGTVKVTCGWVKGPDGLRRSIAGLVLPFHAERIHARVIGSGTTRGIGGGRQSAQATVYNADAGSGYGMIDSADPSSVDDLTMAGGANQPWQNLTFGVDIAAQRSFLIRWRCWSTYTTGRGHDAQAFDNEFADFGVIYPATDPGTWKITISVQAAGVVSPEDTLFMAQQFRTPQPDGEGAFDTAMKNVYNPAAPPTVGTSENEFWYDWDPTNGVYAEDEIDYFGDSSYANMLRTITVSGTQDTVTPYTYTVARGTQTGGDLPDLWYSDDSYVTVQQNPIRMTAATPNVQLDLEAVGPTNTVNSLTFMAETAGTQGGGLQTIKLWNYQTNAYDTIDERPISGTDQVVSVTLTNNPSKYVSATKHMKARILFFINSPTLGWKARIDRSVWLVTH